MGYIKVFDFDPKLSNFGLPPGNKFRYKGCTKIEDVQVLKYKSENKLKLISAQKVLYDKINRTKHTPRYAVYLDYLPAVQIQIKNNLANQNLKRRQRILRVIKLFLC